MNHVNIIGKVTAISKEENKERKFRVSTNCMRIDIKTGEPIRDEVGHPVVATGRWLRYFNDDTIDLHCEIAIEGYTQNDEDGNLYVMANDIIVL